MAEVAENCSNSAVGSTWGGGRGRRSWPPLSHLQQAGVMGGEGGGREQIRLCTRCSLHAFSLTLCLSFSYLFSAVEASFNTKKARGKPYTGGIHSLESIPGHYKRLKIWAQEAWQFFLFHFKRTPSQDQRKTFRRRLITVPRRLFIPALQ